ncbi:MAG: PqqD family peptide modification chaperone [Phycisphaerales bacterium]|nr:PqqD family peptide modification chaperone [Phycisphaerales bacterium]
MTLAIRPTFSESWYRIADLKVRLRPAAQITRQFYRGERWYVVRDPAGNQYHRLSDSAYHFVALLDGQRTIAQAWEQVGGQYADAAPTQPEVIQLISQLWAANLVEANITPDAQVLLRRHKQLVKQQWQQRMMSALFPRFPLWDPDQFLQRWMPVVGRLLSKAGAILWIIVITAAVALIAPHTDQLLSYGSDTFAVTNWIPLWGMFVLTKFIHELGHAFSTRRFGGECHEMGIMLLVLIPTPYVDASSAWSFRNKWHRLFVGAAGMIFELFFASFMAAIWVITKDSNSAIAQLAFNSMMVASISTLLFNANPLLRYDGYYMLSDWLEIPNLQQKSSEYALGLIKRHVFRVKLQRPLPPISQRLWLLVYAICSSIYRVFIGIMIILMVAFKVPVLGALMALGGVATWVLMPVVKITRYVLLDPELQRKRAAAAGFTLGVVAAVLILIGLIRFPVHYEAVGVLEAQQRQVLRARTEGFVAEIGRDVDGSPLQPGDLVKQGQVILVGTNEKLDQEIIELQSKVAAQQISITKNRVENQAQMEADQQYLVSLQKQLNKSLQDKADLTIRAPFAGELVAARLDDLPGRYLQPGQEVCTIATLDDLVVRTLLTEKDGQRAHLGFDPHPEIRLAGDLSHTISGFDPLVLNASQYEVPVALRGAGGIPTDPKEPSRSLIPLQEVRVHLKNQADDHSIGYRIGQRAHVRFELNEKKPLIWQWSIRFWQLINREKQQKVL